MPILKITALILIALYQKQFSHKLISQQETTVSIKCSWQNWVHKIAKISSNKRCYTEVVISEKTLI